MIAAASVSVPVAGLLAILASLVTFWVTGLRADRARRRELYANALEAAVAYREFPYVVRRRDHTALPSERVRISEALREVQRDLAKYEAMLRVERHTQVHVEYKNLVAKTREIAGDYIRKEWEHAPITTDAEMNVNGGFDYSGLAVEERAFMDAAAASLHWWQV